MVPSLLAGATESRAESVYYDVIGSKHQRFLELPKMAPIIDVSPAERDKILALHESHFCDLKSIAIQPAKLTRTISALSNAEGGEVYIGVEEDKTNRVGTWNAAKVARSRPPPMARSIFGAAHKTCR